MSEKTKNLGLRATPKKQKEYGQFALDHDTSVQAVFERAMEEYIARVESPQKTPETSARESLTNVPNVGTITDVTRDTVLQGLSDGEKAAVLRLIAVLKVGNAGLKAAVLGNLDLFGDFAHAIASRRVPAPQIPKNQLREVEELLRKAEALNRREGEAGGPGRRMENGA